MTTEITVYERVENPLEFAREMGKAMALSGIFGCRNEQQGIVLAMACLAEKKNPIELARTYHIIDGKLSMRADAMLAEFRARGGKHRWLKTGDDGQQAEVELAIDGQKQVVSFTMQDAHRAELVRPKSNWVKYPGEMLRARAVSKGIRMLAPEIVAGCYVPEEIEDGHVIDVEVAAEKPPTAKELMRQRAAAAKGKPDAPAQAAGATPAAAQPVMEEPPLSASGDGTEAAPPPIEAEAEQPKPIGLSIDTIKRIEEYGPRAFGEQWPDAKAAALKKRGIGRLTSLDQEQADELLEKLMARAMGMAEANVDVHRKNNPKN